MRWYGNYLCNILRQRLQDYRPVREGSVEGACTLPRKKLRDRKLFISRKDTVRILVYSCAHAPIQWNFHHSENHMWKHSAQ